MRQTGLSTQHPHTPAQWRTSYRLATHLHQALACVLFTDVSLDDVLLEEGEQVTEQRHMVAEEAGASNAPGVQGSEGDASLLVQAPA